MKKHLTINIFGKLKNSGFRFSAVDKALELDLKGLVKNYQDTGLEIEVEGEVENLQKFLKWCHVGPKDVKIDKVEFKSSEELQNFEDMTAEWFI